MENILQIRITNCLETLIEVEERLKDLQLESFLQLEFLEIKEALKHIGRFSVSEQEVSRIEAATAHFLSEMRQSLMVFDGFSSTKVFMH